MEVFDLLLEALDFRDRALHGDLEGFHGAFQPLEKVDFHHANKKGFALALRERESSLRFIHGLVLLFHEPGGVEKREFVGADFVVELVVGEESAVQVDLGVDG